MESLYYSRTRLVESAYVITLPSSQVSTELTDRCVASCNSVEMPVKKWEGYDGINNPIIPPTHLKDSEFMKCLKIKDHYLTRGEVACALSHISLWLHCAAIDKPIVILEHDAIMIKKFVEHSSYNSIIFLGSREWTHGNWPILSIPPFGSDGTNNLFIGRAHAYAIDPPIAKNLLGYVLINGINDPLDIMIKADLFNITHCGVFAYDEPSETTILARPESGRTSKRNERLLV